THQRIPAVTYAIGRTSAVVNAPPQKLLDRSTYPNSPYHVVILHVEELRAELVEASPEIALVIGGQLVFVVNPNLVEHSSEIDNAADLCRWAANAQLTHRSSNLKICAIPSSFFLSPY